MLFERIESEGLSHYSYIIGDMSHAVVIDPRRDCEAYVEAAKAHGMRITHVLETHRHEDFVSGTARLAAMTGAEALTAERVTEFMYGRPVSPHEKIRIGRYVLEALDTPGHTPGSVSYLLYDADGNPWMVFAGDTLFAGDVGRTDLLGKHLAEELAGKLYESIFELILPLGDHVILCPAHGAGSVCAESIADRPWTTLGQERMHNPKLQAKDKDEFVALAGKVHEKPPYMSMIEAMNLQGPIAGLPVPPPLSPRELDPVRDQVQLVDTRMELGFGSAHVKDSLSIWAGGLASFAGWFLSYDSPIVLVTESQNPEQEARMLYRMGFDTIGGCLSGGLLAWHMSGLPSESVSTLNVQSLCTLLDTKGAHNILDVRSEQELEGSMRIPDAIEIPLTQLQERKGELPHDKRLYIFCGSGMRSMTAASILKKEGIKDLVVVLGGLAGWNSSTCPLKKT